jgi:metallo-beta-lactamase family protein
MAKSIPTLRFLGATRTVTGSRFLIEGGGARLLLDCGLFQGEREVRRRNWASFPVPAWDLDAVVLSHAHLDHCGWLPRLVQHGYGGPVLCTPGTARLAPIVLRDAAHLQEEDARTAARGGYSRHDPPLPLFTIDDAEKAIALLVPIPVGVAHAVHGAEVTLHRAGHILGSATIEIRTAERALGFSGDLGRPDHPLLVAPDPAPAVDTMLVESTYGDRRHRPRDFAAIADPLRRTFDRGGVVLIPAFAIDRTPVLLMALRQLTRTGELPVVPVYVDSPMALAALDVYRGAFDSRDREIRPDILRDPADIFDPGDLRLAHTVTESKALNDPPRPCIIISASGMATGGRVVHHLEHLAPEPQNLILLPGYQVMGTRGRALLEGASAIKAFGRYIPVRAATLGVEDFSAHADADGVLAWLRTGSRAPATCYVVHGEESASHTLAGRINRELHRCAVVPRYAERVLW